MTIQRKSYLLEIPHFRDYHFDIYPLRFLKCFCVCVCGAHVYVCVHKWVGVRMCKCVSFHLEREVISCLATCS